MDPTAPLTPVRPPRRLSPRARDVLDRTLVLVLLAPLGLVFVVMGTELVWLGLGLLQIAPLWWRRTHPVAVFAVVVLGSALQVLAIDTPLWSQVAWPVALYSVARFGGAVTGWVALGVSLVASLVAAVDWLFDPAELTVGNVVPMFVLVAAIVVTAWTLGTLGRVRAAYVDGLLERNQRIEREAAQQVALAATEERTRIARELHDVVAHSLSVIIVQADGARYAAEHDPTVATTTLGAISRTGREALTDMRRMLGLLRSGDTGTAPVPDLGELRRLVDEDGVEHRLTGLEREVPGAVALTTYRVVQEALTNVRKHAGPDARASVSVAVGDTGVAVDVRDHGRGAAAAAPVEGGGHGLVGMRERVAALGGEVSAGPAPGGGFAVSARIPL
ncbi:sensor histidine kinase [uncultured Nocardioides sp.]|uniref:sensor histidine kinase n=1 Tax=uncultured Nocardioides sp. TaxID=198441 RepID=UPI00260E83BE|nr:sensor histidine kinase [uncultured Nocardioides sp.]